jgi:integrase
MPTDLKSKTQRAKLKPRREPYWQRLTQGLFVGYRATKAGTGTWIARQRGDDGRQKYRALGTFVDFDVAKKEAEAWATELSQGVEVFGATVDDACHAYVDHLKARKGATSASDADGRFRQLIYGRPIGRLPLNKLQTRHVDEWLNAQVAGEDEDDPDAVRRSKDTANRNFSALQAALNRALHGRMVATDAGWATVRKFPDVGVRRNLFLSAAQRIALLEASPDDLAVFMRAMLLTAARPGELASVTAQDFDRQQGTLALSGKTGRRTVTLSTAAVKFFADQSKGKIGAALVLARADTGGAWTKDWWKKQIRKAAEAAGLGDGIVLYHLRHAAISEMIAGGMDSHLVAKLAGTSTAMIDQHYGHLHHDRTRAMLDSVKVI